MWAEELEEVLGQIISRSRSVQALKDLMTLCSTSHEPQKPSLPSPAAMNVALQ